VLSVVKRTVLLLSPRHVTCALIWNVVGHPLSIVGLCAVGQ